MNTLFGLTSGEMPDSPQSILRAKILEIILRLSRIVIGICRYFFSLSVKVLYFQTTKTLTRIVARVLHSTNLLSETFSLQLDVNSRTSRQRKAQPLYITRLLTDLIYTVLSKNDHKVVLPSIKKPKFLSASNLGFS